MEEREGEVWRKRRGRKGEEVMKIGKELKGREEEGKGKEEEERKGKGGERGEALGQQHFRNQ